MTIKVRIRAPLFSPYLAKGVPLGLIGEKALSVISAPFFMQRMILAILFQILGVPINTQARLHTSYFRWVEVQAIIHALRVFVQSMHLYEKSQVTSLYDEGQQFLARKLSIGSPLTNSLGFLSEPLQRDNSEVLDYRQRCQQFYRGARFRNPYANYASHEVSTVHLVHLKQSAVLVTLVVGKALLVPVNIATEFNVFIEGSFKSVINISFSRGGRLKNYFQPFPLCRCRNSLSLF